MKVQINLSNTDKQFIYELYNKPNKGVWGSSVEHSEFYFKWRKTISKFASQGFVKTKKLGVGWESFIDRKYKPLNKEILKVLN